MKVYVITSGEYSDYHIDAVSDRLDEAEKICGFLNSKRQYDFCEIEEFDTDEIKVNSTEDVKQRFDMKVGYSSGRIYWFDSPVYALGDMSDIKVRRNCRSGELEIDVIAVLPKGTDKETAKKIMLDRVAKFKAKRAGI